MLIHFGTKELFLKPIFKGSAMPRGLEAAKIPDMNHTKANDIY